MTLMEAFRATIKLNNILKDKMIYFFLLITITLHITRDYKIVIDRFRMLASYMKYIPIVYERILVPIFFFFFPASRDCCFGNKWDTYMRTIKHLVLATKIFHSSYDFSGFIQHSTTSLKSRAMVRKLPSVIFELRSNLL